jgi:hypothetical protein
MQYKIRMSHWMQKHKFGVTCPATLVVESVPVSLEHENSASMFHGPDASESTT